jgi:hypothetical protein
MRRRRLRRATAIVAAVVAVNAPIVAAEARERLDYAAAHASATKAAVGVWDVVGDSRTRAVHAAVLYTGKVLLVEGSGNDQLRFDARTFSSTLWDPVTDTFRKVPMTVDFFCGGHTFLADGRLLVAGGTRKYEVLADRSPDGRKHEFQGLPDATLFDPATETYSAAPAMAYSRWYPTLVTMGDGRVVAVSGLDQNGVLDDGHTEVFDPATSTWTERADLRRTWPTYAAMTLTADGRLFYSGANAGYGSLELGRTPGLWDLRDNSFTVVPGLIDAADTETSMSVLLPPAQAQKVAIFGGGGVGDSPEATARTAVVDLTEPAPSWRAGPDLAEPKRYPGAVVLPDDTVLVTGGGRDYRGGDSHTAQLYHPDTDTFTDVAAPRVGRNYHAEAVLLPDGRVATFGSNPLKDNRFETRVEVYSPAYLFRGPRPVVHVDAPEVGGGTVRFTSDQPIARVRFVRPSAVTHQTDTEQRSVAASSFEQVGDEVRAVVPADRNLMPPGWYMMFALNAAGVPSLAQWVHV